MILLTAFAFLLIWFGELKEKLINANRKTNINLKKYSLPRNNNQFLCEIAVRQLSYRHCFSDCLVQKNYSYLSVFVVVYEHDLRWILVFSTSYLKWKI